MENLYSHSSMMTLIENILTFLTYKIGKYIYCCKVIYNIVFQFITSS